MEKSMEKSKEKMVFVFDLDKTIGYFTQVAIFIEGVEDYIGRKLKKQEMYNSKIQLLGIYMPSIKLWKWGWSLVINKKDIYMSRKILNYALDIDNFNILFLKYPLINSNITINNQLELDLLLGVSSYLTKQKNIMGFYKIPDNETVNKFYEVGNLKEKDDIDNYMIVYYILVNE